MRHTKLIRIFYVCVRKADSVLYFDFGSTSRSPIPHVGKSHSRKAQLGGTAPPYDVTMTSAQGQICNVNIIFVYLVLV